MVEETIKTIKETENEADEIIRKADATCTEILEKAAREAKEIKEQAVANAKKQAKQLEDMGFGNCPICMAKTQYSLTDDQTKLGAPKDFESLRRCRIYRSSDRRYHDYAWTAESSGG